MAARPSDWSSLAGFGVVTSAELLHQLVVEGTTFGENVLYIQQLGQPPEVFWQGAGNWIADSSISPNGRFIAFVEGYVFLRVLDSDSGMQLFEMPGGYRFQWSPDSKYLAILLGEDAESDRFMNRQTAVVATDGWVVESVLEGGIEVHWEPEGSLVVRYDDPQFEDEMRLEREANAVWSPSADQSPYLDRLSPGGTHYVQGGASGLYGIFERATGENLVETLSVFDEGRLYPEWSDESWWWIDDSKIAVRGSLSAYRDVTYIIDLAADRAVLERAFLFWAGEGDVILATNAILNSHSAEALLSASQETGDRDSARLSAGPIPAVLECSTTYDFVASFLNDGTSTWTVEDGYELRAVVHGAMHDPILLEADLSTLGPVSPGETLNLSVSYTTPAAPAKVAIRADAVFGQNLFAELEGIERTVLCNGAAPPADNEHAPVLTYQPVDQTVLAGQSVSLTCDYYSDHPAYVCWWRDSVSLCDEGIPGAETPVLTIDSVSSGDAGAYSCKVSNEFGEAISAPAELTVAVRPHLTEGPAPQAVSEGSSVSLSCLAAGTEPLAYSWHKDGQAIVDGGRVTGASTQALTISNAVGSDSGQYSCRVANDWGEAISAQALVSVGSAPIVTTSPASVSTLVGTSATFSCSASGSEPLAYQWLRNGVELVDGARVTGSATPSVTVSSLVASDAGGYSCRVANGFGEVTSVSASLVIGNPPQVTSQPAPATAIAGGEASFSCAATGDGTLSYQWQKDGADLADDASIEGAATAQVTIRNVDASSAGTYRCLASSDYGQALSDPAALDFESWRAYPVETLSSNWISSEPVHDQLDDPTTVVTSRMTAGTSLSDALTVRMAPMSDPDTDLGHEIHVRARALDNAPVTLRVHLMRGSTSLTYQNLEFGFEESVAVVAIPPEAATNLEDYGDVQIKVVKFHEISGNNSDRRAELVEVEFRVPEVSAPVQRVAAVGTTATNSFSPTPVHEQVDDLTNVVTSSVSAGTSDSFTLAMASMTDPGTDEGHVLRVRGRALDNEPVRIRIMLLQGGTTLKYWGRDLDFEESTVRVAIPASVASGLTDYSDVRVRIVKFNELWNESNRRAEINWIELEAPLP